jgi:hypothetical protein
MKLLLHICCAPCTIYPLKVLRAQGMEVHGFYYNPNIHPYQEFRRRLTAVQEYAPAVALPLQVDGSYDLEKFLRLVVFREEECCRHCYTLRLQAAALAAVSRSMTSSGNLGSRSARRQACLFIMPTSARAGRRASTNPGAWASIDRIIAVASIVKKNVFIKLTSRIIPKICQIFHQALSISSARARAIPVS